MAKKSITIKEIATILNVSISTVSKALNDSSEIGAQTKKRVKEVAALYNYKPNFLAKSLKNQSTQTIGVVVPDILNYFFVRTLFGIEQAARAKGYKVVTCISHESLDREVENVATLTNGQVDGILICPSEETQNSAKNDHIDTLIDLGIPVVTFDRTLNNITCSKVVSNDFEAAYSATKHLVELGAQRIALFTAHSGLNVMHERIKGYTQLLIDRGVFDNKKIFHFEEPENATTKIAELLQEHSIDAVLTTDELLSVKTIKAALQTGIVIPSNLKVIGFSNGEISKEFHPAITSVDQHAEEIGKMAAEILIDQIESSEDLGIISRTVPSTLVTRNSSDG